MIIINKQHCLMLVLGCLMQGFVFATNSGNPIDNQLLQSELVPIKSSLAATSTSVTILTSPSGGSVGTEYESTCATTGGSCLIFVTGTQVDGAMNLAANSNMFNLTPPVSNGIFGLAAGDSICQQEGNIRFGTGKIWKVWLSSSLAAANTRVYQADKTYFNVTRTTVALARTLLKGYLINPMRGFDNSAFTGTKTNGTASAKTCLDWLSNSSEEQGMSGELNGSDKGEWTEDDTEDCHQFTKLYCFEQG